MRADFHDAHGRHLNDADRLMSAGRWANADHLYGLAAECGLKRLMAAFGMQTDSTGSPTGQDDRQHADRIWPRYESYRSGRHLGAAYSTSAASMAAFADWNASQRYAHQQNFDEPRVTPHQSAAQEVSRLLLRARSDGLVP